MTTLYIITRVFTFFGAMLRAFWQHVACRVFKIPVEDARAFKGNELCGHIEHELPENLKQSFLVCWLPFTMNLLLGCAFLLTGSYRLFFIGENDSFQVYGLVWLGFSCFANCAPSFEDMLALKDFVFKCENKVVKIILAPFTAVVIAVTYLEKFSLTFPISIVATVIFPAIFNLFFPLFDFMDQMVH